MSVFAPFVDVGDKVKQFANWTGETVGELTGSDEVEKAAIKAADKSELSAEELLKLSKEQSGAIGDAGGVRTDLIDKGYGAAIDGMDKWSGLGEDSLQTYEDELLAPATTFGTDAGAAYQDKALGGIGPIDPRLSGYQPSQINPNLTEGAETGIDRGAYNDYRGAAGERRELSTNLMERAGVDPTSQYYDQAAQGAMPQSQYFDQAAQTMANRPSRLEDIEGYGLMQQARDEALQSSAQGFAGQGKMFSGSRMKAAGDIGANAAMGLMDRDNARRQQEYGNYMNLGGSEVGRQQAGFGNLMNLGGADVHGQQTGFGNLMNAEGVNINQGNVRVDNLGNVVGVDVGIQQGDFGRDVTVQGITNTMENTGISNIKDIHEINRGVTTDEMNYLGNANNIGMTTQGADYGAKRDRLNLMGGAINTGIGIDSQIGGMNINRGADVGASGYGTVIDQTNTLMGGKTGASGLINAGSNYRMEGASARQDMFGDVLQGGASLAGMYMGGNPMGGMGGGGGGGVNYGGGYSNDNYLV